MESSLFERSEYTDNNFGFIKKAILMNESTEKYDFFEEKRAENKDSRYLHIFPISPHSLLQISPFHFRYV